MMINNPEDKTSHEFTFSKGAPQPELSAYKYIWGNNAEVSLSLSAHDKAQLTVLFTDLAGHPIDFSDAARGFPPLGFLRNSLGYLPMIFDHLRFRVDDINRDETIGVRIPEERIAQLIRHFHTSMQLSKECFCVCACQDTA
jgi:hypothetical protein